MIVTVHLFARFRDVEGAALIAVPMDGSVADLREALRQRWPALTELLRHTRIAVNDELATDSMMLNAGDVIALIPPVSGG